MNNIFRTTIARNYNGLQLRHYATNSTHSTKSSNGSNGSNGSNSSNSNNGRYFSSIENKYVYMIGGAFGIWMFGPPIKQMYTDNKIKKERKNMKENMDNLKKDVLALQTDLKSLQTDFENIKKSLD